MPKRSFALLLLLILIAGFVPRALRLHADPPAVGSPSGVGVIWHDEGAWVHNARNRALWGTWRTDEWNPMYVAPVFTAVEYATFEIAGVGLWQARIVSVMAGLLAIAALGVGLRSVAGPRAALAGSALLATNYAFIMWNRAALLESTMVALLVCAWAAYALGARRTLWAVLAGVAAVLAWFTKAAAAFFVAALVFDILLRLVAGTRVGSRLGLAAGAPGDRRLAVLTLAGLAGSAALMAVLFVVPHWTEYQFYNWQMSVVRKPEYSIRALVDRASWIPLVQGLFSQMWIVLLAGSVGLLSVLGRWRVAGPGERLLLWWVLVGFAELVVHDSGNERRYVMFIPALVALAAVAFAGGRPLFARALAASPASVRLAAIPALVGVAYLLFGTAFRAVFLEDVLAGRLSVPVRLAAALAAGTGAAIVWQWRRLLHGIGDTLVPVRALTVGVACSIAWNGAEYVRWAASSSTLNYEASVALADILPPGTLVQGKLANGLALENRIRPLFIGNGFGNYDDRLARDDVRYILTYDLPRVGYESVDGSGLIQTILDEYPDRAVAARFEVDETPGPDRAILVDKFPGRRPLERMRQISPDLIKAHADRRFRSEYDYALFEYYRSAKVLAVLDRAGVAIDGRVLDAGCGGGGMPLSLAEHASQVVGIDPIDRFGQAGVVLAAERGLTNLAFARADGMALPFRDDVFDLVLSHAVIEHVADAERYLGECRRVLARGGHVYLSTAPYLSFAGAHLPRLRVPVPLHLIAGRAVAFRTFRVLARHAPWTLREPAHENSFIRDARRGIVKHDDLLEKVRVRRLRGQIARAGLRVVREELHATATVRRLPGPIGRWLRDNALTQDALISNIEYVLATD